MTEPTPPDEGATWTNPERHTWTNPDWSTPEGSTWSNPVRLPQPPAWTRFAVTSRLGWGQDFVAADPDSGEDLLIADGQPAIISPRAEIRDAQDTVRYWVEKVPLSFGRFEITDVAGQPAATLAKELSFFTPSATITVGEEKVWNLTGDISGWRYAIDDGHDELIRVNQEFTLLGQGFTMDVAGSVDPALALAMLWAIAVLFETS